MSAETPTAPPITGQAKPSNSYRKDSKSPGGVKQTKKTYGQKGRAKERRGRSGNRAADRAIMSVADTKAADEEEVQPEQTKTTEAIEDEKDTEDTFEDAPDTTAGADPAAAEAQSDEHTDKVNLESHEEHAEDIAPTKRTSVTSTSDSLKDAASIKRASTASMASNKRSSVATTREIVDDDSSIKRMSIASMNSNNRASVASSKVDLDGDDTAHALAHDDQVSHSAVLGEAGGQHEDEGAEDRVPAHKPQLSTTTMDNVSLGDSSEQTPTQANTLDSAPHLPPRMSKELPGEPVKGLSGDLPSVNYPPPPPPPDTKPLPHPPPAPTRKVSSPFAWFSRATSRKPSSPTRASVTSISDHTRKNTASSLVTLGSNPDTDEPRDRSPARPHRSSLKDRFQLLRLQEETIAVADDTTDGQERGRSGSVQEHASGDKDMLSPPPIARSNSFSVVPTPTNTKLPPGTAAGAVAGPSEHASEVNWDLWQSVVYEGPAAVARTSGEELSHAIASGIPQPIRGVVWQVLADSKNADLEVMYRDLVVRGTDKDTGRPLMSRTTSSFTNGTTEKESLASSASSVKSDTSTPATVPSPGPSNDQIGDVSTSTDKKRRSGDDKAAIQKLEKTIKRDLGARTSYSKYIASAGLQDGLFGICKAYALFDEAVGYAQGMNFIAMPLLFNMPEEEAFTLFVRMMSKYDLRSMFTAEMTGLHRHLYQFERLLEDFEPALYCHLHRRGVTPDLYATQWFLTLFAYRFPLQLVLRVYDLILSEGLSAILKFGIALMQKNSETLLGMKDMSQLSVYLKEKLFDVYIDKSPSASSILESGFFGSAGGIDKEVYRADELVRDACAVIIPSETLAAYAAEYEETQRVEKEREAELENLRSSNTTLTSRVRRLEERAQQHDTEHVSIASELVRTKVENESLQDENEGLKTQVAELRKMVEMQPAEVEERLRAEMDRIMQRNIEVQNENRALEESVQETEQELVGTKMMFAQLNAEHDAMKQKLASIQTMLNDNK